LVADSAPPMTPLTVTSADYILFNN
jgi:hypothetical protein